MKEAGGEPRQGTAMSAALKVREPEFDGFEVAEASFSALVGRLKAAVDKEGCELLQAHLDRRAEEKAVTPAVGAHGVERTHHRPGVRKLETLLGTVEVTRDGHGARGKETLFPLVRGASPTYSKKTCCLSKSSTKKWPRRQGCFFFRSPRSGCTSTPVASVAMQNVVFSAYAFAAARMVSLSTAPTSPNQRLIVPRSMVTPSCAHDISRR